MKVIHLIKLISCYKLKLTKILGGKPDLSDQDPHVCASLLKQYLRELPEPLLTFELYECFLAAACLFFSSFHFLIETKFQLNIETEEN